MRCQRHAWMVGAVVLFAFLGGERPAWGQYTGASAYPYWGSAPSGYRGETWADRAIGRPYGLSPSPSYLMPSIGMGSNVGSTTSIYSFGGYRPFAFGNVDYALLPGVGYTRPRNTATIRLHVPEDAKVWFEGEPTRQKGTERVYHSPALTPGKNYTYEISAEWTKNGKPVKEKRDVRIHANGEVSVDFTRPRGQNP